jgi:hypothetical protein
MTGRALVAVLLLVAAGGALGQSTVYRCGNEYSRSPCRDGRPIDTSESARTAAQRDEALRVAASERKLADDMERDRRGPRRSGRAGGLHRAVEAGHVALKSSPGGKAKKTKKKGTDPADEDFVAVAPKVKG